MNDFTTITIRFPDGMLEELRDQARQNNRSRNSEIIHRLGIVSDGRVTNCILKVNRTSRQSIVRMPHNLYQAIRYASDINGRSINSECIARLSLSLYGNSENVPLAEFTLPPHVSRRELMAVRRRMASALDELDALITRAFDSSKVIERDPSTEVV